MAEIESPYLGTWAAAAYYRISPKTLERWRVTGEGPEYIKLGRKVFYTIAALDAHAERRRRRSTSEAA